MVHNNGIYNTASPDRYMLLKEFAKKNKQHPTEAEKMLWEYLRGRKLWFKFNRQHIVGDYIVDFICIEKSLVVEIDGGYHSEYEQIQKDEMRTDSLRRMGFRVIRFANEDVYGRIQDVIDKIKEELFK
ncbi:MAG: endonuclease domain-containing protein [Prevotella sp.]|nr:endonuclease domain-containing protein [Prevotella sp.]